MKHNFNLVMILLVTMLGSSIKSQVGINTDNPEAIFEVNGSVKLYNLGGTPPELGSMLESVDNEGNVQWVKNIAVPKMLFIQSGTAKQITPATFNADITTLHTPIFSEESKTSALNTLGATFIGDNTVKIPNGGTYEISGYINYNHFASYFDATSEKIRFNLIVRKSTDNGKTWTDIAGARYSIFPVFNLKADGSRTAVGLQALTASLPSHIVNLEDNCLIQYGFVKVETSDLENVKGTNWFYIGAGASGMNYTNSLKITRL